MGVLTGVAARKNEVGDHGGVGLYVGWNEGGMRPRGEERYGAAREGVVVVDRGGTERGGGGNIGR